MKRHLFTFILAGLSWLQPLTAQCTFTPTITGDTILCPEENGILITEEYESYQWYKRPYSGNMAEMIPGANEQALVVTQDDGLNYFSVEVTKNGCTEVSAEILLDGYVFLLPFVIHEGDYTFDPVSETFRVCEGDTMFLILGSPYQKNITWFKNGLAVEGENSNMLAVTESGAYTVEGAPAVCPNYIQQLGLTIPVVVETCATGVEPSPVEIKLSVYPNPASGNVTVETCNGDNMEKIQLTSVDGRVVQEWTGRAASLMLPLDDVSAGVYFLKIRVAGRQTVRKLIRK